MGRFTKTIKRARGVCQQHESRIVIIIAACSIAVVSFAMGMMTQSAQTTAPLIVGCRADDTQLDTPVPADENVAAAKGVDRSVGPVASASCMYVGSKKSTKYYPPTCSFAKHIAPENLRCFTSDDDARAKGYVRSTGC